jgi:hypothetical protein
MTCAEAALAKISAEAAIPMTVDERFMAVHIDGCSIEQML